MADPRFFLNSGPLTLAKIAEVTGSELKRGSSDLVITDVASLDAGGEGQIGFLDNIKYKDAFKATKIAACFVAPQMVEHAPEGVALLVTKAPYRAYALTAQAFYPDEFPVSQISPQAHIHPTAKLGQGCVVEAGAAIGEGVEIGSGCDRGRQRCQHHVVARRGCLCAGRLAGGNPARRGAVGLEPASS